VIARIQLGKREPSDDLVPRFLSFVKFGEEKPAERALIHEHLA